MPDERVKRLRAIRRRMSFETFERTVPVRPGWKREYYDGMARVRPGWTYVAFELDLAPVADPRTRGLRPLQTDDADELLDAFLDSFRVAPEYAEYPIRGYRKRAAEYVAGFYGDVRGTRSEASTVCARGGRILAAALVKERADRPPLLDCLLVRPADFRQGLASAVVRRAANQLAAAGHSVLRSGAKLANDASLAWHFRFGFRERPDYFVAQARYFAAANEYERRVEHTRIGDDERLALKAEVDRLRAAYMRVSEMKKTDFDSVFPDPFDH